MPETDDLAGLSRTSLLAELQKANEGLEDIEEDRMFTLGQTGVHIGAGELARLKAGWERDEKRLRARVEAIERALAGATTQASGRTASEVRAEIDDLMKRWPAHSVQQSMATRLEELEEELTRIEGSAVR